MTDHPYITLPNLPDRFRVTDGVLQGEIGAMRPATRWEEAMYKALTSKAQAAPERSEGPLSPNVGTQVPTNAANVGTPSLPAQPGAGDPAPTRIFLQNDGDGYDPVTWEGASWCADRINESDVEYIRADLATLPAGAGDLDLYLPVKQSPGLESMTDDNLLTLRAQVIAEYHARGLGSGLASQEEGPAGVDLASIENALLAGRERSIKSQSGIYRDAFEALARLRAQAPASPPRTDLSTHPCHGEAARILSALPSSGLPVEEVPIANRVALKLFSYAYGLETEIGRLRAAHPPEETPIEAAPGLEPFRRIVEKLSWVLQEGNIPEFARGTVLFSAQIAAKAAGITLPEYPAAPATPIEAALAAYLEVEKAYQPHRAELREAMGEWVKTRTPNELIALIRTTVAGARPAIEKAARPMKLRADFVMEGPGNSGLDIYFIPSDPRNARYISPKDETRIGKLRLLQEGHAKEIAFRINAFEPPGAPGAQEGGAQA